MKSKFAEPLAIAVAAGSSIKAAAEAVRCSAQTAYNISATHEFRTRVSTIRTAMTAQAVGRLAAAASEAVDTLRSLLDATNEPSVRLNAAKAILANLGPISEHGELRQRIDQIERGPQLKVVR